MARKIVATGFVVAFAAMLAGSGIMCAINATASTNNGTTRIKILSGVF